MHISTKVEKCLADVILEIYKKLLENPTYSPPSSREIKAEVTKRLKKEYPTENLKIALGTVQLRLQKLIGAEFYGKHYRPTISNPVEQFLKNEAELIKKNAKVPGFISPKTEQIIEKCKFVTGQSVSPPTIHNRFQKELGQFLYSKFYPKIIFPVNANVEAFLKIKATEFLDEKNKIQSLEEIAEECYITTSFPIGFKILTDRLKSHLGKEKYFHFFTKKIRPLEKAEQTMIGEWWISQAELMLKGRTLEVETISAFRERINRDYATIHKYGEKALKEKYGERRWCHIYSSLTTVQRENWTLGFVNHQLLERIFQRGFRTACRQGLQPVPEMFREVSPQPSNRCDLLIADVDRGRFLQECLSRKRNATQTMRELLGLPPGAAWRYTDVVIDFTTRRGQEVLKEKALKYCDGKTFVIVACTGDFPLGEASIRSPDFPDVAGIPALLAAELIRLPDEHCRQVDAIIRITVSRNLEELRKHMLAERERNPEEIDWEIKQYREYIGQRDQVERKGREQAAFEYRQREKGQQVIDNFFKSGSTPFRRIRGDSAKTSEARDMKDPDNGIPTGKQVKKKLEKLEMGRFDEGWFLQVLRNPINPSANKDKKIEPLSRDQKLEQVESQSLETLMARVAQEKRGKIDQPRLDASDDGKKVKNRNREFPERYGGCCFRG